MHRLVPQSATLGKRPAAAHPETTRQGGSLQNTDAASFAQPMPARDEFHGWSRNGTKVEIYQRNPVIVHRRQVRRHLLENAVLSAPGWI
jgi:hypothetical protein